MENIILLEAFIGTCAIISVMIVYIKLLKKKMRRFVLRNEKISGYIK